MSESEWRRLRRGRWEKHRNSQVTTLTAGYGLLLTELKAQKVLLYAGIPFGGEIAGMAGIFAGRHRRKMGWTTAVQIVHVTVEETLAEFGSTIGEFPLYTLPSFTSLLLQAMGNDPLSPEKLGLVMQVANGFVRDIAAGGKR
jgi:hypothetical protein